MLNRFYVSTHFNYPPTIECSELPPDDSGNIEIYLFDLCDRPPLVGERRTYPDGVLQVVEVHSYLPPSPGEIEAVYVAVCTVDGSPHRRQDWFTQEHDHILYIMMKDGKLVEREPDIIDWGIASSLRSIDGEKTLFTLKGDRPVQGYAKIAVCDLTQVPALI
ncbi:hypothetical protein K9N68_38450 (plasmid) [Kovacikia minuta CCNUW1]|uniref:hypothetical protein n=1 Tax=Kovacikia minuta TaxID=2931930 RepID=UPI001CCD925B|nr:hypothetical protein [Kovacikia minuta]UBF30071.1 hypothetical protein K9N68_38450 [Kovacikia minuta CCNUW1]